MPARDRQYGACRTLTAVAAALAALGCPAVPTGTAPPKAEPARAGPARAESDGQPVGDALPEPVPAATIEIDGADKVFLPDATVRGTVRGLPADGHQLAWRDRHGVLDVVEVAGPGDRTFELAISYPRLAENELALVSKAGMTARAAFWVDVPPAGRRGYLRVLAPGEAAVRDDFPAEAVVWDAADGGEPPKAGWRDLVVNLPLSPDVAGRLDRAMKHPRARCAASVSVGRIGRIGSPDTAGVERFDGFVGFLRDRYGTVEKLAGAWAMECHDWDEVRRAVSGGAARAFPDSSAARWDWAEFAARSAGELLDPVAREVRHRAPEMPVGLAFAGVPGPECGGFGLPGVEADWCAGAWSPGARRIALALSPAGRSLAGYAAGTPAETLQNALAGELIQFFSPEQAESARACGVLARGLGRLIEISSPPRAARRRADGDEAFSARLALVYSPRSAFASSEMDATARPGTGPAGTASGAARCSSYDGAWTGWTALLGDLGIPFVVLTEDSVAEGALSSYDLGAVVLVRMMSVSDRARDEFERFASDGGVVIADAAPGIFDGMLRRSRPGVLADLFGVRQEDVRLSEAGIYRAAIADRALRYLTPGGGTGWFQPLGALNVGPAQTGLVPATRDDSAAGGGARAEGAFGDIPCLTVNRFGGGRAVVLNLAISAYPEIRARPTGGEHLRRLIGAAMTRAGARSAAEIHVPEGTYPPPGIELRRIGGAWIAVVSRPAHATAKPVHVRISLAGQALPAVYDAIDGSFVGWTKEIETDLAPGGARVYAMLPYRLRGITASAAGAPACRQAWPSGGAARQGPEAFSIALGREGEGGIDFHVIDARVTDPDGRARAELGRVVDAPGGRAELVVPFARSDQPGLWTLELREALTGMTAIRRFVRGPAGPGAGGPAFGGTERVRSGPEQ